MKRIISFVLLFCICLNLLSVVEFNASAEIAGYYTYSILHGEAIITDVDDSISGDITIPSTLGGNPVIRIGDSAFYNCAGITSVEIPNGITSIGNSTFSCCGRLKSLEIPNSVESIGNSAFEYCIALKNVNIPNGVANIGEYAFRGCTGLTSVIIPKSVTNIGDNAFSKCAALAAINVEEDNDAYCSVSGVLFNKEISELIMYPEGKTNSNYAIPLGVTSIGWYAFDGCTQLANLVVPNSVKSIGHAAFRGCSGLKSIDIPNSVTSIGSYAFYNCVGLESVSIPNSVISIGASLFEDCTTLTSVKIPNSVTSIGRSAFEGCTQLVSVEIPKSVINIDAYAFEYCTDLKEVWYIGTVNDKESINISNFNENLISATWHYVDNACDTNCNICEKERDASNHIYDNACDDSCNECGDVRIVPDHVYDNACDINCNECGKERIVDGHIYVLNSGHTCSICKYSKTPQKPTIDCKYSGTVALIATEGFEYSVNGTDWQDSTVFVNLTPATEYTFYQRVKQASNSNVSQTSEGLNVILKLSQAVASAPNILSFTDTSVKLYPVEGCEYSVNGTDWQKSNEFTGLSPATEYIFYQRNAETGVHEAGKKSSGTNITTDKSKQLLIPNAPVVENRTKSSITLVATEGCEYSMNGTDWQSSNVFTGLAQATEYTFYQRYTETSQAYAGKASEGTVASTEKGEQIAPESPTIVSKTHERVELGAIDGYEYSKDGVNWQASPVFDNLQPETSYIFYQRKAGTEQLNPSPASSSLIVRTKEQPPFVTVDNVMETGVYTLRVTENNYDVYDLNDSSVIITDEIGNVIVYNKRVKGWPLLSGEEYNISFIDPEVDYLSSNYSWNLIKRKETVFPDTYEDGWYYDAVIYSAGRGIVVGYENGYFGTTNGIQRQDFLLILARLDGADLDSYATKHGQFPDVGINSYYEAAVNWGYKNGIVTGYNNGLFGVSDMITREQMVTFLYRYAIYKGLDVSVSYSTRQRIANQYADYGSVTDYATEAVIWAIDRGIIEGKNYYTIAPQGTAQRCEIAQMMYNIYKRKVF